MQFKRQNKIEQIVFPGLIFLLVFAPFAFGSVHVWAYTLIELGIFFLLLLHFAGQIFFSEEAELKWVKTPINIFLIFLIFLIILQLIPLPSALVGLVSPTTLADNIRVSELMAYASGGWFDIAYYLHPAITEGLKLLAYGGMFFLMVNIVRSRKQLNTVIHVLISLGLFEALYAVFQEFSHTPGIWWWKGGGRGAGTFVGSNHFAFYMEMSLSLAFGFAIAQKRRRKRFTSGLGGLWTFVQKLVSAFSPESAQPKMFFFFFMTIVMGLSLLMSASRGGILSMGAAMAVTAILFFAKKKYRRYGAITLGLCLVALVYGLHIGIDPVLEKFERTQGLYLRLYTTGTISPMISDYPLLGVGWGGFRHAYPRYVPKDAPAGYDGVRSSGYSHNDWLEATAEVGLIGGGLILLAFFAYLFKMIRIWRKRRDRYAVGIGAGVITALVSVGLHSFFDFSMHIPANPLTLAALMGIGYVVIHMERHNYERLFFYRVRRIPLTYFRRIAMGSVMTLLFVLCVSAAGRHFLAEISCPTEWNSTLNLNLNPYLADIEKAIELNPRNADYHFRLADYYMRIETENKLLRRQYNERAVAALENAARLNPLRALYWYKLGEQYSHRRYDSYDYLNKWLPLADQCFDMAVKYAPNDAEMLFRTAHYWIWRSIISPDIREAGIQKFQQILRHGLEINPRRWKWAAEKVWEYYADEGVVFSIMPEDNEELKSLVLEWMAKRSG